jgi:hypothetical protein
VFSSFAGDSDEKVNEQPSQCNGDGHRRQDDGSPVPGNPSKHEAEDAHRKSNDNSEPSAGTRPERHACDNPRHCTEHPAVGGGRHRRMMPEISR